MEKKIEAMVKTAKLIREQVQYARHLDGIAQEKSLRIILVLAQDIIDAGEGY